MVGDQIFLKFHASVKLFLFLTNMHCANLFVIVSMLLCSYSMPYPLFM